MHEGPTTEAPPSVAVSALAPLDVVPAAPAVDAGRETDRARRAQDDNQGRVPPARRGRRRWRVAVAAVACLLLAVVVAGLVRDQVRVTTRADRVRDTTSAVRHQLHLTTVQLQGVRQQLAAGRQQLGEATTALTADQTQLAGAKSALDHARQHVSQQSSVLADLNACLVGVESSLNALSVGDQPKAVAALTAVEASCKAASDGV